MQNKLLNVVRYQHQKFNESTDPKGLEIIMRAFISLKPLEDDIIKNPDAVIDFMSSGNILITGMPDDL